jgi:hypothetical protein
MQIPLGFYNKVPLRLYGPALLALMVAFSVLYLQYGHFLGRSSGWTAWLLPVWVLLIVFLFCYQIPKGVMFLVYSAVFGRSFLERRGHVAALLGDDIASYVPVAAYLALAGLYIRTWGTADVDVLASIRTPWRFLMIGGVLAAVATASAAWLAFRFAPRRLRRF